MKDIVIIGNGISGVTAARHIRKLSDFKITIISAESDYFFSRTALMYVFMGHMKFENTQPYENWFWKKNRIGLKKGFVETIDAAQKKVVLSDAEEISFDSLIIATGSKPNKFGWPGQELSGVQGMYSKQDLEELEENSKNCKRAVIVGGGLIGIEMAEMLHSRNIPVTFLVREASFWRGVLPKEQSEMVNREVLENHIDLRLETNLVEIISDENGHVKSVVTDQDETIECTVVGLTAGVSPNIDFVKNSDIALGRGVLVNPFLETNCKDIYAIGDCAEQHQGIDERRPIEAVWYTGRMMGETVARTICGKPTEYKPGHWFNSAKFIDLEYQTYGWVWAEPKENESRFCWQDKTGKKSIHINYDTNSHQFIGINTFGIRLRHERFDTWLNEKASVEEVLMHLKDANFDPEFFKQYEQEIIEKFNKENGTDLQVKSKSWERIFSKS